MNYFAITSAVAFAYCAFNSFLTIKEDRRRKEEERLAAEERRKAEEAAERRRLFGVNVDLNEIRQKCSGAKFGILKNLDKEAHKEIVRLCGHKQLDKVAFATGDAAVKFGGSKLLLDILNRCTLLDKDAAGKS